MAFWAAARCGAGICRVPVPIYLTTLIPVENVGNSKAGTLRPALGFKIGYVFEGFWTAKEKT